jgi:hypothetical protein
VRKDEKLDPVLLGIKSLLGMPLWLKKFLAIVTRKLTGDEVWASMLEKLHVKSPAEERSLVVSRDEYRAKWHSAWEAEEFDFVLTVPHALPAIPAGTAEKVTLVSCGYMMIFNIVSFLRCYITLVDSIPKSWTMLLVFSLYLMLIGSRMRYQRIS